MTSVRTGRVDELDAAVAVWRSANPDAADSSHPGRLRAWAAAPDATLLVAPGATGLAGMVLVLAGRAEDGAGDLVPGLVHLTGLAVAVPVQGQGIGRTLLLAALAEADRRAAERVTLWTGADNVRARTLFAAHGFVATGRTRAGFVHLQCRRPGRRS